MYSFKLLLSLVLHLFLDIPDDDDDEIIIDENKVVQESITLGEGDTTPGTFNTYRFQKNLQL